MVFLIPHHSQNDLSYWPARSATSHQRRDAASSPQSDTAVAANDATDALFEKGAAVLSTRLNHVYMPLTLHW
jgi:hypothetical protein